MTDNKSLQDCLAFIFPTKGFDEQLVNDLSSAVIAVDSARSFSVDGLSASLDNMEFEKLSELISSGEKALAQLANGNWVVPLGFEYENGEIAHVDLFDPLARDGSINVTKNQFMSQWTGLGVLLHEAQSIDNNAKPSTHTFSDLTRAFREYQHLLSPVLFSGFMVSLLSLASPFFFMLILDKVVSYRAWSTLTALVVGAIFLIAFEGTFEYIRTVFMNRMTKSVGRDASAATFSHTTAIPSEIYESRSIGAWIHDNRQSERLVRLLRHISIASVEYVFAFIFLAVLLWINWILTCVAIATCLFQIGFAFYCGEKVDKKGKESQDNLERKESLLIESLTHLHAIKMLGLMGNRTTEYCESITSAENARQAKDDSEAFVRSGTAFIERSGNILMLAVGAAMVMQSSLTVGALVACNILMRRLTGPLAKLPMFLRDLRELKNIQKRWQDISRNVPVAPMNNQEKLRKKITGALEFKKVFFRYGRDSRFQLMIDAKFPRGEIIAVVGKSGAGKTTLTNLMLGLNSPQVGLICMDGSDLRELNLEHMRQQIGIVTHETGLFRGSVQANIASWDKKITLDRIQNAARMACIHDAIQALPRGYDTIIGDDGANLSSGQKSRLALARALVRDPALLILDEVTGDLDPSTEHMLVSNIINARRGRTTIFLTHREFVANQADIVYLLDDGRVIASGKHERLTSDNVAYRALWGRH